MSTNIANQGSLFTSDFLTESIRNNSDWKQLSDDAINVTQSDIKAIFGVFPVHQTPNESQTENDLIWKVLEVLGWTKTLQQQNLSPKGREDVPDGLLFDSEESKAKANSFPEEWKRYEFGSAIMEAKRWGRPLDRLNRFSSDSADRRACSEPRDVPKVQKRLLFHDSDSCPLGQSESRNRVYEQVNTGVQLEEKNLRFGRSPPVSEISLAALKFLKNTMRRYGSPKVMVTDKLRSFTVG